MTQNLLDWLSNIPGGWAFTLVLVVLLLCGLGVPIPEEICILAAGYLSYLEVVSLPVAIVLVVSAVLIGDVLLYSIGRRYGNHIFQMRIFKNLLTPDRMLTANRYFQRWGNRVVFIARFLVGVRGTVFLTAGILKMPFQRFIILDGIAALITVPLNLYLVHIWGDQIGTAIAYMRDFKQFLLLIIFISFCILLIIYIIRRSQRRSRLAFFRDTKKDLKK